MSRIASLKRVSVWKSPSVVVLVLAKQHALLEKIVGIQA